MMTTEINGQMLIAYQQSMMKNSTALKDNLEVGDIIGAAIRHIAAQTMRLARVHA